jgi:hypothetical protein
MRVEWSGRELRVAVNTGTRRGIFMALGGIGGGSLTLRDGGRRREWVSNAAME